MAEPKMRPTDTDVSAFLATVASDRRREEATLIDAMMREATGERPVVWGESIVGYGVVDLPLAGGKSVASPVIAFSPRKAEFVVYLDTAIEPELFDDLGPHRRGASCLYLKRVDAVNADVLRRLIARSVELSRP